MHAPPPQQQQHYPGGRPHPPPMMSSSSSASVSSGKTPIAKRTRSSRGRVANDRTTAPAPATTNIAPLPNNNNTNYNQQQPQQPPQIMRNTADEAIAKRKAELRRLQEQQGRSARITERLSQQRATAASSRAAGGATTIMRGAVVNNTTSRFGTAVGNNNVTTSSSHVTARRLDESYNNTTTKNAVSNNATAIGGPPAPQRTTNSAATTAIPMMAVKRTSELFPPKRSSTASTVGSTSSVRQQQSHNNSSIAPTATTTSVASHQFQQNQPPPQKQQSTTAIPPPKKQQYQQQQQPPVMMTNSPIINYNYQSPSLSSVQSTSSSKSSTTSTTTTTSNNITKSPKSPFGQARVTKVIPALSLNGSHTSVNTSGIIGGGGSGGGIKSLVPPLSMLDPPNLLDEGAKVTAPPGSGSGDCLLNAKLSMKSAGDGGVARTTAPTTTTAAKLPKKSVDGAKLPMKSVDGAKLPMKSSVTSNNNDDNMTTPRHNVKNGEEGEEGISSGQSTPIHTNHMEGSPPKEIACDAGAAADVDGISTGVVGGGNKNEAAVPDVSTTLQEAKMALNEQKVNDDTPTTTTTATETDSNPPNEEKEKEENNQPPQSKKERENVDQKEEKEGNDSIKNGNTNTTNNNNLSRLKLDLERSEKEKLEALEEVAKLKSLLEAGGVGGSSNNANNNGMSTIDTPNRTINTPRSGGFGGVITPRGGNTPNRFTPSRGGGRPGIPPLGWSSPRSGNSRVGSRTGSPEHGGHPYGSMSGSGTPRVRASPLPKQLNRVISDSQLNNRAGEEGNDNDGTTTPREERVEEEFLVAAAISIPNEYGTNLASYFVRRPHVTDDSLDKEETDELAKVAINLWNNKCTHLSSREEYMKHASVFNPESLEIVACIEADGSVFTLSGEYNARHGKVVSTMSSNGSFDEDDSNIVDKEYEWSVFDNVEDMDRALGRVSYIDVEGNERDYWLDSIYEEALTTREAYCTSMISAAFILKEVKGPLAQKREQPVSWNQTMQPSQPVQMQSVAPPKSTMEGSLNTSYPPMNQQNAPQYAPQTQSQRNEPMSKVDVHINPTKNEPSTSETAATTKSAKEETKQKQSPPPPPDEYEPSDSALTVMVVYLFSIFFKLTWLVIKTPFRIGSMLFTFWVVLIALRVLCLFLADDNGAWDIGAGVEYEYNMPGIY